MEFGFHIKINVCLMYIICNSIIEVQGCITIAIVILFLVLILEKDCVVGKLASSVALTMLPWEGSCLQIQNYIISLFLAYMDMVILLQITFI